MRLRYTAEALVHLEAIYDFIFERNPAAARRIAADIPAAVHRLVDFPEMGRKGEASGSREWVVRASPYLIVYEFDSQNAKILVIGVFHGAQDRRDKPD